MQHNLSRKHNLISAFVQGPRISRAALCRYRFRLRRESEVKLIKGGSVLEKKPNQPPRIMMTADEYDKY